MKEMAYLSHFCKRKYDRNALISIKSDKKKVVESRSRSTQISWILLQCAFLIVGFALIALASSFIPKRAAAFWLFSSPAYGAESDSNLPDASTPVLRAPLNSNPNVSAPLALAVSNGTALVSSASPSGTITDNASVAPADRISVYVVREGDTLSEIAQMFNVSVNTIVWANNLKSNRDVHPGDTLIILPVSGVEYTVKNGDTLKKIANTYGADATEIAEYNGLDSSEKLTAGSTIIIPGGELSITQTKATTKSSGGSISEPYLGGSGPAVPGYFSNPLPGGIITQSIHGWNAVDIGAPKGTPIHAAAGGTVIIAKNNGAWNGGYGNYVVITDTNGTQTLYAHMTREVAAPEESVSAGEIIGYVGQTGEATGPHLHFEVRGAANPFRNCPVGDSCAPQ